MKISVVTLSCTCFCGFDSTTLKQWLALITLTYDVSSVFWNRLLIHPASRAWAYFTTITLALQNVSRYPWYIKRIRERSVERQRKSTHSSFGIVDRYTRLHGVMSESSDERQRKSTHSSFGIVDRYTRLHGVMSERSVERQRKSTHSSFGTVDRYTRPHGVMSRIQHYS